jgi:hypothetical protein
MVASRRLAHSAGPAIALRFGLVAVRTAAQRNLLVRRHIDTLKRRALFPSDGTKSTVGGSEKFLAPHRIPIGHRRS